MTREGSFLLAVCSFAAGVCVMGTAHDWQQAKAQAAKPATMPAPTERPLPLGFPLCDTGNWVATCADGRRCAIRCLAPLGVDDPAAPALKPKGHLKPMLERRPQRPLAL